MEDIAAVAGGREGGEEGARGGEGEGCWSYILTFILYFDLDWSSYLLLCVKREVEKRIAVSLSPQPSLPLSPRSPFLPYSILNSPPPILTSTPTLPLPTFHGTTLYVVTQFML